ncbi:MAG TPA: PEGA domain-containing protein [Candidatus Saccharimonadales bacterium]|nr:PEGA domain-containing protein [Candidatus Saccharimonadales bacterium]
MPKRLLVILSYLLAALLIVGGTVLLIAYGNGYSYDFKSGRLQHRGLVILESIPSGAKITVDGKLIKQKTPYRNTFVGGQHDFVVSKDGYRTWHKLIEAIPAQVSLAQYVILMPQHIQAKEVVNRAAISQFMASRDHRRIGYVVPTGPDAGVWWVDSNSRAQTKIFASAPANDTQSAESVQLMAWSDDATHLMVRSQIGDAVRYLMLSSGGDTPINLTDVFKVDLAVANISPSNWREIYLLSGGELRRLDIAAGSTSPVLADHVMSYSFAGDRVVYVDGSKPTHSLWLMDHGGKKQQLVSALPAGEHYSLDFATYIGSAQVAVVNNDTHRAVIYGNVFGNQITRIDVGLPADTAKFNSDGRFLLVSTSSAVGTYDVERDKNYAFSDLNNGATGVNWFDNYHLLLNRGGLIVMTEFDGNYSNVLTKAGALPAFSSTDNKSALTVATTSTGEAQIRAITVRK